MSEREHDPLCPLKEEEFEYGCPRCEEYADVRADERSHGSNVIEREHDPLCPNSDYDGVTPCWECEHIYIVRSNERYAAAQRVYANCAHTKWEGSNPCVHDVVGRLILMEENA